MSLDTEDTDSTYDVTVNIESVDDDDDNKYDPYKTWPPKNKIINFRKVASTADLAASSNTNGIVGQEATNNNQKVNDNVRRLDGYMKDGFRKIDFVLVYEKQENNEADAKRRQYFERNMENNGLQLEVDEIEDAKTSLVFLKIHAPWHTLCSVAEEIKLKMPLWLDERPILKKRSRVTVFIDKIFKCNFFARSKGLFREQVEKKMVTWPFSVQNKDRYAIKDRRAFFSSAQRIEIVWEVLQKTRNHVKDPRKRGIEELIHKKIYLTGYPLHEGSTHYQNDKDDFSKNSPRMKLISSWASWRQILTPQPLRKIQKYFGHKIGFYFAFMDFYLKMLTFPAIAGLLVILYGLAVYTSNHKEIRDICDEHNSPGNYVMCPICIPPNCDAWLMFDDGCFKYKMEFRLDNEATVAMSCLTIIWAIVFLKMWKRQEAKYAADWDTIDYKVHEATVRPIYENTAPSIEKNPVTLVWEPHWPFRYRAMRILLSIFATIVILCLAELTLLAIIVSRIALYGAFNSAHYDLIENHNVPLARFLTNKFIFISVVIFELIYTKIAFLLTNFECPKTNYDFLKSLLWKLFIFKLFNNFLPVCYAAFLKGKIARTPLDLNYIKELCDGGCMGEIVELICVLLIARLIIENILEVLVPLIKNYVQRYKHGSCKEHHLLPRWLKDFHLSEVVLDGVYKEYMEMMIQFAFVIFCVAVFPATPFICFINNIFEIRIDAIKLLKGHRRPRPERVKGIHIWNHFMDTIVKVGIIFNAALIAFSSESLPRMFYSYEYSNSSGIYGFTEYSLSNVSIKSYRKAYGNESYNYLLTSIAALGRNDSVCWYTGYTHNHKPYNIRCEYWKIMSTKFAAFGCFMAALFTFMWLINTLVDDIPPDVRIRMKRRKHIVMKSLEAEGALKKRNVKRLYEANRPKVSLPPIVCKSYT